MKNMQLYCVFMLDDDNEMIFMHAFDTPDALEEYVFENEHLELYVEKTFIKIPECEG